MTLLNVLEMLPLGWDNKEVLWQDTETAYQVVRCSTQNDMEIEGRMLAHCLGTKEAEHWAEEGHRVFSIRGPEGVPHATILTCTDTGRSPYGFCRDLFTSEPMVVEGEQLWVLQVRGRADKLAHSAFHGVARRFYSEHKGVLRCTTGVLDAICEDQGDDDVPYHFFYRYDPMPFRRFNFKWHDAMRVQEARKKGDIK
jgi:hypothetical protein